MNNQHQDTCSKTIIYVNFAPYENTGNILDYLRQNFFRVLSFSFNFHTFGKKHDKSVLSVYEKGKIIQTYSLFQITIPSQLTLFFLFLPIRSLLISFQIILYALLLAKYFGPYDVFFTVNAYTAVTGILLKKVQVVKRTVFWVWDYYPPLHENLAIRFVRGMYWFFDALATRSDAVVFLNNRLQELRKQIGILPKSSAYPIVPIGTNPYKKIGKNKRGLHLAFMGVLKRSQGLDLIFDNEREIALNFPNTTLHVIGSGPDEQYFRKKAKTCELDTVFYGLIVENDKQNDIISSCDIGIAPYKPEESNVSYYGDPSKIKMYLSCGLPVVTTNVFVFSQEIQSAKAGILIDYYQPEQLIQALKKIRTQYAFYQKNVLRLAAKYHYKNIYPSMFGE